MNSNGSMTNISRLIVKYFLSLFIQKPPWWCMQWHLMSMYSLCCKCKYNEPLVRLSDGMTHTNSHWKQVSVQTYPYFVLFHSYTGRNSIEYFDSHAIDTGNTNTFNWQLQQHLTVPLYCNACALLSINTWVLWAKPRYIYSIPFVESISFTTSTIFKRLLSVIPRNKPIQNG